MFNYGPKVSATDTLWSEFKACWEMGIDPEIYFSKERHMRALITGGVVAGNAIDAMRSHDLAKEREVEADRNRHKRR